MVTRQLQVERRTGKVRRPKTDVLPLCHAINYLRNRWTDLYEIFVQIHCDRGSEVDDESRMAAAQFLLDLIEIRDNCRHSGSFLSFNEVYDITLHLATQ